MTPTGRFAGYGTVIGSALDGIRAPAARRPLPRPTRRWRGCSTRLFVAPTASPADDVISRIGAAEGDADPPDEMVPMCTLLLVAGFETTVNLIGNAVNALLADPDQWAALCADPALAGAAVEETLRWDPPVQRDRRSRLDRTSIWRARRPPGQFVHVCSARPTATRRSSPTRTASTSPRTGGPSTWPSPAASTTASGRRWPGWRRRSPCSGWPNACRGCAGHGPYVAATPA